ncbi:acetyltransferase [Photobacterium aquae]|uniref:Acetyltransferase n=1 Tax=Photobacterium aquae TaxID=1195763 RepID=A0A0J1GYR4_9GAMM|nr:GNAT family N-acetyltransferase [Photobacterium aquae]KLV04773.1 acetyltransferase [Photobacterium aquae]
MNQSPLTSARLTLRPYKQADLQDMLEAILSSTESLYPWLPWCTPSYNQHDAQQWIQHSMQNWTYCLGYEFAIFANDQFVGSASLSNISEQTNSAELGYWIRQDAQRQGYATEAAQAVAQYGFEELGLTRIEIVTHLGNLASQRTALACRAKFECTARNRIMINNTPQDGLLFSLIPSDFSPPLAY